MSPTSTVTIIDPFTEYVEVLKESFDFDAIREFAKNPEFSILFDGMHGAGGPFAQRILVEGLGFPEVIIIETLTCACSPLIIPVLLLLKIVLVI